MRIILWLANLKITFHGALENLENSAIENMSLQVLNKIISNFQIFLYSVVRKQIKDWFPKNNFEKRQCTSGLLRLPNCPFPKFYTSV